MVRRLVKHDTQEDAASQLDRMVKLKTDPPKSKPSISPYQINMEIRKINNRIEDNDWDNFNPKELVALYSWCHNKVYETMPEEMNGNRWMGAKNSAISMVKNHFEGDVKAALAYFKWVWAREESRVKWIIEKGYRIRRINWYDIFKDGSLLTDYRTARIVYEKTSKRA